MLRSHLLIRHLSHSSPPLLSTLWPGALDDFKLRQQHQLTKICQSLRDMERVRICDDPVLEACYTANGQSILGTQYLASDVIFIRSFYERIFELIRLNRQVILIGNPGISKSV
jgi:hypothetical protein